MAADNEQLRIDKYLFCIRLYKTRTLASEACAKGQILLNDQSVKPSRIVKVNDIISVKQNPIYRKYQIIKLLNSRIGAKLVQDYMTEVTSQDELFKLKLIQEIDKSSAIKRDRGTGRPTKKDRRDMDKFTT